MNSVRNESINSVNYRERVKHESNTIKMINHERKKYILIVSECISAVYHPLLPKIIVIIIGFIGNKLEFNKHWVWNGLRGMRQQKRKVKVQNRAITEW